MKWTLSIAEHSTHYLFIYLYFDRITYIINEDVQINTTVFSKGL